MPDDGRTPCPVKGCTKTYKQLGRLNNHLIQDHPGYFAPHVDRITDPPPKAKPRQEPEPGGHSIRIDVEPGLTITLIAPSRAVYDLALAMCERHEIPINQEDHPT